MFILCIAYQFIFSSKTNLLVCINLQNPKKLVIIPNISIPNYWNAKDFSSRLKARQKSNARSLPARTLRISISASENFIHLKLCHKGSTHLKPCQRELYTIPPPAWQQALLSYSLFYKIFIFSIIYSTFNSSFNKHITRSNRTRFSCTLGVLLL